MSSQNVTELERWVVRNNTGTIVARFATQAKAIDYAHTQQKLQKGIVLIDLAHSMIQLITHTEREEQVG